jgi:hypothetical protein
MVCPDKKIMMNYYYAEEIFELSLLLEIGSLFTKSTK